MNYSLEYASESIYDPKTKEYFKEVLQTYQSGNYRSSVVMLYTVVICDLLYKLQDLRDLYNDDTAKSILEKIERQQTANAKSSEWENTLLDEIKSRTNLLELSDQTNIEHLKNHRNLCAHPAMNNNFQLYSPTKENVRSHIRNMLDGVLTKPPLLSKKVFNEFVTDLSRIKDRKMSDEELKRYLESRYFRRLNIDVRKAIFKSLWKCVFIVIDEPCNENRSINWQALKLMFKENKVVHLEQIKEESQFFSNINPDLPITWINEFLCINPEVYSVLTDATKTLIKTSLKGNEQIIAFYLSDNIYNHILKIKQIEESLGYIFDESYVAKLYQLVYPDFKKELIDLMIDLFKDSYSFDEANVRYNLLISPYLAEMNKSQTLRLLDAIQTNSQIYMRRQFNQTLEEINEHCDRVLGSDFDYTPYTRLNRSGQQI
ncbi:hypothetical protein ACT91Q_01505 [Brevibacillus thermoruber]|uniref:hypothetical protein n=1 Tax=Brevibacillus thermoruber TaxID=33942 RepID=UPI0040414888